MGIREDRSFTSAFTVLCWNLEPSFRSHQNLRLFELFQVNFYYIVCLITVVPIQASTSIIDHLCFMIIFLLRINTIGSDSSELKSGQARGPGFMPRHARLTLPLWIHFFFILMNVTKLFIRVYQNQSNGW